MKKKLKSAAPLVFLGGLGLLLTAGSIAYIQTYFGITSRIIGICGIALSATALFFLRTDIKTICSYSKQKRYSYAIFLIILLSFFAAALNYTATRFSIRWDATRDKQHTLTQPTRDILAGLTTDVTITVLYVGLPPKYIEDLLGEYTRLSSGHITTQIIDPILQISEAAQFDTMVTTKTQKAIVESGVERQDIDFRNTSLSEALLTNALIKATRNKRKIYFLSGHNEYDIDDTGDRGLSAFQQLLTQNNSENTKIVLGIAKQIPDDCDLLIIPGPYEPLTESEQIMIQEYLKEGGRALFLIESMPLTTPDKSLTEEEQRKNPTLNEILNDWGVVIGDDVVVDLESHVGQDVGCPATNNYPPHDQIVNNIDYTFYIRPRSITATEPASPDIKIAPIVQTASKAKSWAESNTFLQVKFSRFTDIPGPISIGAVIWQPKSDMKEKDTKIIVFTDTDFLSNQFIAQYSNAQLGLNAVAWLTDLDNSMPIKANEGKSIARVDLTSKQKRGIVVILLGMPVMIAIGGCLVWYKQRRSY